MSLRASAPVGLIGAAGAQKAPRLQHGLLTSVPALVGLILAALGGTTMGGWLLRSPALIGLDRQYPSTVFEAALCFALMGLAILCGAARFDRSRPLQAALPALVLLIAGANLAQIAGHLNTGIDLPGLHRWLGDSNPNPGQMTAPAALCFVLGATSLLLLMGARRRTWAMRLAGVITGVLFAISLGALLGYSLDLEILFRRHLYDQMPLRSAIGAALMSVGLWRLWSESTAGDRNAEQTIRDTGVWFVAGVAALASLTSVVILKSYSEEALAQELQMADQAQTWYLERALEVRAERAAVVATRPDVTAQARTILRKPDDPRARQMFRDAIGQYLPFGFNSVALIAADGAVRLVNGDSLTASLREVPIHAPVPGTASLLWDGGAVLRNRFEIRDGAAVAGFLVVEQRLGSFSQALQPATNRYNNQGMELCGKSAAGLSCFPAGSSENPYVPGHAAGEPALAIELAAAGGTGAGTFLDRHGALVIAAYGPVGQTGLYSTLNIPVADFYASLRARLLWGFALVAVITLLGALLMRSRIVPILNRLAESERMQRTLIDSLADYAIFTLDARGCVGSWSPVAHRIKGYSADEILGRHFSRFYPQDAIDAGKPEAMLREAENSGRCEDEGWRLRKDGSRFWANVVITARRDQSGALLGYSKITRDLTERRRIAGELAQSNRLREEIVTAAPFAIVATDLDGVIQSFNPAAERMLWYAKEDVIGIATPDVFHDPQEVAARAAEISAEVAATIKPGFEVFAHYAREGINDEREWTFIRKDGLRFPVNLAVSALRDSDGGLTGFLGVAYDITEQKRQQEYTRHVAHHDALTGLPNRILLNDRLDMALKRARRGGGLAVMMIDLDHFKRVNDSLGHHVGDELLQTVARRLQACVRLSDTVARMGGDEFVVLLADVGEPVAERIARSIVQVVSEPIRIGIHELAVTPSVGVSRFPADGEDVFALLKNADTAMYHAKAAGRAGYLFFNPEMERAATQKIQLEHALRRALKAEEFFAQYQPQVCLNSGRVLGMEALLRWRNPEGRLIPPAEFIPVAEETGLILPISDWMLRRACADARAIELRAGHPVQLAVNLSPKQFERNSLVDSLRSLVAESGFAADHIELEITEGMLMADAERAYQQLRALRDLGFGIAVDDFGTGYSSLSYVARFPITTIKIDRSFIGNLDESLGNAAVIDATIALAHRLKVRVCAEGVETAAQLAFLRERQCDCAQGYVFGRPVQWEQFSGVNLDLQSLASRAA